MTLYVKSPNCHHATTYLCLRSYWMDRPLCFDTQVIVMSTLMMACRPRNNLRELHSKKTTQIVTKTRARFISPCRLDEDTFVRAFLIPLKKNESCISIMNILAKWDVLILFRPNLNFVWTRLRGLLNIPLAEIPKLLPEGSF